MDTPAETVRRQLMNTPADALCDGCLAVACGTPLTQMEAITATLRQEAGFARGARCASCRRTSQTTCALPRCTHCALGIGAGDPGVVMEGDRPQAGIPVQLLNATNNTVVASATTNADGSFTLENVPPGSYRITARKSSSRTQAIKPVELASGQQLKGVEVKLYRR